MSLNGKDWNISYKSKMYKKLERIQENFNYFIIRKTTMNRALIYKNTAARLLTTRNLIQAPIKVR